MRRLLCFLLLAVPALSWSQSRKFQNPTLLPTANDPGALAVGDWNGDNKPDLIYIDGSVVGALHVLLGNGDGTFTLGQTIALPADACRYYTGRSCYLSSADINGDGKADLVFAGVGNSLSTTEAIFTLLGNGDGTFGAPIVSNISSLANSAYVTFKPGIADFNGDRKIDLVVADPLNGGLYFLAGDGAGHFVYSSRFNNTKYDTGRPSLVYATTTPTVSSMFSSSRQAALRLQSSMSVMEAAASSRDPVTRLVSAAQATPHLRYIRT